MKRVRQFMRQYPDSRSALTEWAKVVKDATWASIQDTRKVFPHADAVTVKSGRTATVFNIRGNNYRLIVAIHYNTQLVFVMRFITHKEYNRDIWKDTL